MKRADQTNAEPDEHKPRRVTVSLRMSPRTQRHMRTLADWQGTSYSDTVANALERMVQLMGLPTDETQG